jgi:drug/metabolite transporter (DMT)-like permease
LRNGLKRLSKQLNSFNYQLSGLNGDGAGASTAGAAGAATFGADFLEDFFFEDFFADFFLAVFFFADFFFFATFFLATFFLEDFFADFFLVTLRFATFLLEDFFADFFFDTLRFELFLLELFFDFLRAATYPPYGVELLPIFLHYIQVNIQPVPTFLTSIYCDSCCLNPLILSHMNNTISRRGLVALIASMLSWGLGNPFADMAIDAFSITQLLLLEISIGFAFVALYVLIKFRRLRLSWKIALALGLLEPGFTYLFGNIGYANGSVSTGLIVMSTEVFFVAIIGALFLKEVISLRIALSIVMGFFGVVIAVSKVGDSGVDNWLGVFAFIAAALSASFYVIVARIYATKNNVVDLVFGQLLVGTIFALVIFFGTNSNFDNASSIELKYWLAALFAGLFGVAIPFLLFNYASSLVPTKYSALALNAIPVVGIGFGALLGRGVPTPIQALGGLIVVVSLYVGTRQK